ncbi:MAG: glycosyltransferase, partial [Chthoniobacterales bacterium]|nr:glycosyltransferase [Chthoniobacterales bacterium]
IWEGQSLALIQALSCNLPVLASRIEGNVAILGAEHPGLFSPKDTETYSGLLAQLASDGEFRTEILNSQSELNLPNWEQTIEKFWKLYLEVLKTK